jgi:MarR family 2-MHQ and catechol resistance regulon transcriptional repressor
MSTIQARRDPTLAPVRVHDGFERDFPDGERSATEVLLNLTLAGVVALNRVDELLAPYGLVLKAFNVLAVVDGDPEPLTPTVIGERTLVAKSSVTSILDSLERLGMVRRRPHPLNRRSILVATTERGRSTCAEILHRLHTREAEWLAGMPEPRRQSLIRLLGEVKGLLNT